MSALENKQVWSGIPKENLSSKYEKCRNIAEEIYKRIDITFQIKKLETGAQSDISDNSDQIDSNDLSNETDLFACDKSDSIPSSEAEPQALAGEVPEKYININNNEETDRKRTCKRHRKRFRKRVKKRQWKRASESDASSDEAPAPARIELETQPASPDHAGVPNILILTKDIKPKILSSEKKQAKTDPKKHHKGKTEKKTDTRGKETADAVEQPEKTKDAHTCTMCSMSYRSERGLRRHTAISHCVVSEDIARELEGKPA
uniref:C2H2-type domain-containing protein n=1 Tax=Pectinophora gossypiella TaxID=13191 RepID=A0A1E1W0B0_PECGO